MKKLKRLLIDVLIMCLLFSGGYVYSYKKINHKWPSLSVIQKELRDTTKTLKGAFSSRKHVYKKETTSKTDSKYKSQAEMLKTLRHDLVQREKKIVLYIQSKKRLSGTLASDLYHQSLAYTGVANEGDYLHFHIKKVNMVTYLTIKDSQYYYKVNYTVDYRTSLKQENEVTKQVKAIASKVQGKTTVEKIRDLNDYVTAHVTYGHTDDDQSYSAYGALVNKEAVCEGYTLLFNRLLMEAGVENRVITGTAITRGEKESHAWNIIKVGNVYYDHDVTWNDSSLPNLYYLRGDDTFKNNHFADKEYTTATFVKTYPLSPTNYQNP